MNEKKTPRTLDDYVKTRKVDWAAVDAHAEMMISEIRAYRLRELREQLHITQVQLAERLEVSQNRISKLEHGDIGKSQVETIRKYVEALGGTLRIDIEVNGNSFQLA